MPPLVLTLVSPVGFLRDRGYEIARVPDAWGWWALDPPAGSPRKARPRCALGSIVQIALAEGWEMRTLQPQTQKAAGIPKDTGG